MVTVADNPKMLYWALFIGGFSFISPVLTLFFMHRGMGLNDLFIILTAIVVGMFVFEVPTGAFADRFGPKASFIFGHLCYAAVYITVIFVHSKWIFYFTGLLIGLGGTFFSGNREAFIYDSLKEVKKEHEMTKVSAKIQSAHLIPLVIAMVVGAWIGKDLTESQFVLLLVLTIISNIISLFMLLSLKNPGSHYTKEKHTTFHHVAVGLRHIRATPLLLVLFVHEVLVMIPYHAFDFIKQPFLVESGVSVEVMGLVLAAEILATFVLLSSVGHLDRRFSKKAIIYTVDILLFGGYLLAAFSQNFLVAIALVFGLRALTRVRTPVFDHIKNDMIPTGSRATTLSLLSMVDSLFDIIIFLSMASIAGAGIPKVMLFSVVIVGLGILFPIKIKKTAANQRKMPV